jgi:hypothetical protein
MTKKYHSVRNKQKPDDEFDISEDQAPESRQMNILASMGHLNDPIMIQFFIRAINLIEFFCRQAVENKQNSLFAAIAESLNNNNRETALFNCLTVPDDGVRLAVVKCLFVVPIEQFDTEEINQICLILSKSVNISAGETEFVLSSIYWILTKFVIYDGTENEE